MTMRRFVRIKKPDSIPQTGGFWENKDYYRPVFWHTAIDQDRPVGSKSTFSEHVHNFYHIVLYTKGKGYFSKEGPFESATAGRCVLIYPNQRHDFISRMESAVYSELTFSFENQQNQDCTFSFDQILSLITGIQTRLEKKIILSEESQKTLHNYFMQITDYLSGTHPQSLYHAHRTLEQIFNFLIVNCCQQSSIENLDDRFVRIQKWIEQHYIDDMSIEQLSHMAGVSKGYFFRSFKKAFDTSPLMYQQKLRIEAAKTLLKATSMQCKEIAYRVGFNDAFFFHRIFKKRTQLTPKQYRNQTIPEK